MVLDDRRRSTRAIQEEVADMTEKPKRPRRPKPIFTPEQQAERARQKQQRALHKALNSKQMQTLLRELGYPSK